ncbi:hypothetical protein K8R04_01585 [Candidatus Uhrbacteria bacterium]|nr:hypothetical protein [Candidatus Uhrbacteria bacterium]
MHVNNQLYPVLVRKYGEEVLGLADKTWPLFIPEEMRLVAILSDQPPGVSQAFEVAMDVTEPKRYMMYLDQLRDGKWASVRLFYLSKDLIDNCRIRYA